jgi:hypothetical protein
VSGRREPGQRGIGAAWRPLQVIEGIGQDGAQQPVFTALGVAARNLGRQVGGRDEWPGVGVEAKVRCGGHAAIL